MKRLFFYGCLLAAVGLTVYSGLLYGQLSNRWGVNEETQQVAKRLESFPEKVGDWQLRDSEKMSESVVQVLQCAGYLSRRYVNDETGEIVTVAVLVGPHGPISVHEPEICYSSKNYRTVEKGKISTVRDAAGRETTFWRTTFQMKGLDGGILRAYHAWTFDGNWNATEQPRISYIGKPYLLKMQLATMLPSGSELGDNDACLEFLQDFVPAINAHLFASEESEIASGN